MHINKPTESNSQLRPILVIANSSWYLEHYRNLLINEISKNNKLITMAPIDLNSEQLSKKSIFIPWRVHRSRDFNLFSLFFSFLKMLLLVRAIKPKLIHSHTLEVNLIASIISSLYGIPIVISFTGMGRLSRTKGLKLICFRLILKIIAYFAIRERKSRFVFISNSSKSALIFQNYLDKSIFDKCTPKLKRNLKKIIPGSGLPIRYFNQNLNLQNNKWLDSNFKTNIKLESITLIYCGRLIKSKGLFIFLEILKTHPSIGGIIYGGKDCSSEDSITDKEIYQIKKKNKNINFLGYKNDPLIKLNQKFPILIVPSDYGEGFSRTILESLSLKIPVVCSKKVLTGIFDENQLYCVENNTPAEYFEKILLIIENYKNDYLNSKLEYAYQYIKDNYSEEEVVKSTLNIYSNLLNKNSTSYLNKKNKNESFWIAQ